jgi:hypothetical protein
MTQAEQIRLHLRERYIDPARRLGQTFVTITAGDVHKELGLRNRVPNVCQAMESRILEREAGVKVSSKQGPPSGRGTTFTITYAVEPDARATAMPAGEPLSKAEKTAHWESLRGLLQGEFAAFGGGEAWLRKERAHFYGPLKRKNMP